MIELLKKVFRPTQVMRYKTNGSSLGEFTFQKNVSLTSAEFDPTSDGSQVWCALNEMGNFKGMGLFSKHSIKGQFCPVVLNFKNKFKGPHWRKTMNLV